MASAGNNYSMCLTSEADIYEWGQISSVLNLTSSIVPKKI